MDWRSGSRQNATGSAFRGITTRGRGRGRGRGVSPSGHGGHTNSHTTSPSVASTGTPAPVPPPSLLPPPAQATPAPPIDSPHPKPPSRRGSHQLPLRAPSLSHIDIPKAAVIPSVEQATTPGGRPQAARRASHHPTSVVIPPIPSLKLDPSTTVTPNSPRPKSTRKRSHNRTRSSSKASTQGQLSTTPSIASLKEKVKDTPPHLSLPSAPPDIQSFDLRSNIDTLVERVRAMAMAGSDNRVGEGRHLSNDGHIDWAGDDDDTLPDLDDWVRPKSAEPKESDNAQLGSSLPLLPVEEVDNPNIIDQDKGKQKTKQVTSTKPNEPKPEGVIGPTEDPKNLKGPRSGGRACKERGTASGKTKSRGRHGGNKTSALDASVSHPAATASSLDPVLQTAEVPGPLKHRPQLMHPLPPKPQSSVNSVRSHKSRGPVQVVQPSSPDDVAIEAPSTAPPLGDDIVLRPARGAEPVKGTEDIVAVAVPEPQIRKRAFDSSVDWANAPRSSNVSTAEAAPEALLAPFSGAETPKKRAFDPSVDWSKAPRAQNVSPTPRSPTRPTPSPTPSHPFSPSAHPHPNTAPPHSRARGPFASHNTSPRLSPARAHANSSTHSRSQMNSPERSSHISQSKDGLTHLRAHSSPQTGPGTRAHTSRPIITLDALSRISRTLGINGTTTPPRGQAVEVGVSD